MAKILRRRLYTQQNPFVIPFHTLTFWTGLWDKTTQNLRNASTVQDISTGVNFLEGELTIEVLAVIRKRLLQQGSTNTTYDL
jgi:hypothetical protein